MGFMVAKYLNNFLMCAWIMFFILSFKFHHSLKFVFIRFFFHFLSSQYGFFQFLSHSLFDFFFSFNLFFRNFNNGIKVYLNALNKIKLFSNWFIELMYSIFVNLMADCLIFFWEISKLLFIVISHTCKFFINVS